MKIAGKGFYSDGKFYFGPNNVGKPAQSGDVMIDLDAIVNIYNKGDLIVTKKLFDKDNNELTGSALNGFYMDVYKADESGNPVGNPIKRAVTGANDSQGASVNGQAKFEGLPVYDENGSRISYVVKEVYTAGQADTYYTDNPNSSEHPVLISGGTADAGYIENHQYMSVDVVKKYYNTREYELTGLKYELEGAEIALYQNNGDGTYTYLTTGVTDKNGQVSFGKLKFSADGFVAIEVSIPDREEYKYMVPVEGDYLQKIDGSCPQTLTQAEVDTLSKAALTSATDPKYTGEIDNEMSSLLMPQTVRLWDNTLPEHGSIMMWHRPVNSRRIFWKMRTMLSIGWWRTRLLRATPSKIQRIMCSFQTKGQTIQTIPTAVDRRRYIRAALRKIRSIIMM